MELDINDPINKMHDISQYDKITNNGFNFDVFFEQIWYII